MYLWHNHQRTLWFERLHSEKPTNIYNLMSWNMSGQELPGLYDPAWVHVRKLTGLVRMCTSVALIRVQLWPWPPSLPLWSLWRTFDSACCSYTNSAWARRKSCQSAHRGPTNYSGRAKFGTGRVKWYDSDEDWWRRRKWLWCRTGEGLGN